MPKVTFNPNYNPFQSGGANSYNSQSHSTSRNWKDLFDGSRSTASTVQSQIDYSSSVMFKEEAKSESPIHTLPLTSHSSFVEDSFLYKNRYICISMKSGLVFINIQRALTRIFYDKLLAQVEKSVGASQKLLFPEVLELSLDDKCLFTEIEMELKAVGFEIAEFGKSMYRIEGIPALLSEGVDILKIFEIILEEVKNTGIGVADSVHRIIANTLSQSEANIRTKHNLSPEERNSLIAQLFASSNPNNTPDGCKIINTLTDATIDAMF